MKKELFKSIILLGQIFLISCSTNVKNNQSEQQTESLSDLTFDLPVKKYILKNGLRLLVVENKKLPIVSYYTYFDVGGRFESRENKTTGATHFLEHMMFKGAKKYKAGDFEAIVEGNGGRGNAYTTFDSTVYYESFPKNILPTIIDVEADRMGNLTLEEKSFESERLVVLEERKMRYENSPVGKLFLAMMQEVFKGSPYGGSVIGEVKDLNSLTRDQIYKFFQTFYAPNNAIVVVVGDVNASNVYRMVKNKYGKLTFNKELEGLKTKLDQKSKYNFSSFKPKEIQLNAMAKITIFISAYKGVKLNSREALVLDLLSSMLSGGVSSHLHQKYVEAKRPLFSSIGLSNYNLKNSGVVFLKGNLLKGTSLSRVRRLIKKESKRFCSDKVLTQRELQKTLNKYMVDYYSGLTSNSGIASFVGLRESLFGDYEYYKKELEIYSNISLDEIKKSCKKLFNSGEGIFLHVWEKNPKKKVLKF